MGKRLAAVASIVPSLAAAAALALSLVSLAGCDANKSVIRADKLEWVASVPILEQGQQRQEGWDFPEGATLVSASLRPQQDISFEDEGTQTFYATWFVYEVTSPVVVDTATERGPKSQPVRMPEPKLSDGQVAGEPSVAHLVTDEQGHEHLITEEAWDAMELGATFSVEEDEGGIIVGVTPADPSELAGTAEPADE